MTAAHSGATANVSPIIEQKSKSPSKEVAAYLQMLEECNDDFILNPAPAKQRYLVDGLIPAGKVTLLAGAGGIRKTQMLLELMSSVAYPRPGVEETWLGAKVLMEGEILYISLEEDQDDFHDRFHDLDTHTRRRAFFGGHDGHSRIKPVHKGASGDRQLGVHTLFQIDRGGNVLQTDFFEALRIMCARMRPAIVVIDTANSLCPVEFDKNTAHAQAVCTRLGLIASESGAAVILVHHITKAGEISSRSAARAAIKGTTGIVDGARAALVFWDAPSRKADLAVKAGIVEDPGLVFMAACVKANGKGADMRERYVTPSGKGSVLSDITARMDAAALMEPEDEPAAPRRRGRPPGSKNKPKS